MFADTHVLASFRNTVRVRVQDGPLADYVRWEYPEADRASLLRAWSRARRPAKSRMVSTSRPGHGVRRPLRVTVTSGSAIR